MYKEAVEKKKDSIKQIIDRAKKRKLSIIYCLNEVNIHYINQKQQNNFLHGFDKNASGGIKKSNILVCFNDIDHNFNQENEIKYLINSGSPFRYRVVKANIRLGKKRITILTFHSPVGSIENGEISGSRIKAKFYAKMLDIIKSEKPDVITMDANEPNKFSFKISNWECHDNSYKNQNIVEARVTFSYIDKHFQRVKSGPSFDEKYYDHIFFRKDGIKMIKTSVLDDLLNSHQSDHKPIVVKILL